MFSPLLIIVINPSPKIDLTSLSCIHQNRNIPKENSSHRIHHDSKLLTSSGYPFDRNQLRHTSLARFAKLSPRRMANRSRASRVVSYRVNSIYVIKSRVRGVSKSGNETGEYLQVSTGDVRSTTTVSLTRAASSPSTSFMLPGWGSPRVLPAFCPCRI